MLVERNLVERAAHLLRRKDKVEIARRVKEKGLPCSSSDVSHFFTGYRTYHTTAKGKIIYLTTLEILEARKTLSDQENNKMAQRLKAIAA